MSSTVLGVIYDVYTPEIGVKQRSNTPTHLVTDVTNGKNAKNSPNLGLPKWARDQLAGALELDSLGLIGRDLLHYTSEPTADVVGYVRGDESQTRVTDSSRS